MKSIQKTKTDSQAVPTSHGKELRIENPLTFQDFSIPTMTQQEVAPPPYLWDKIARVLDEQDRVKNTNICTTFTNGDFKKTKNRNPVLFAAFALLIGVVVKFVH